MKRIISLSILIACIAFFSFSCSITEGMDCPKIDDCDYQTKSVVSSNSQSLDAESFRVSESAARLYMKYVDDSVCKWSVTPYVSDGDTLFYIFNSDNGWKIVSGDSRTSPILAENPSGRIVLSETMDIPLRIILDDSKSVVQYYRSHNGVGDTASTRVWKPFVEIATKSYLAKLGNRDSDPHWVKVLIGSSSSTTIIEDTGHLITTNWDQDSPWNAKTPILFSNTEHCKVGCLAVAIGQIMYHFNSVYGEPSGLYESVTLDTQYNNWQQILLSNWNDNSSRWNSMSINRTSSGNTGYVADLLAYIGHDLEMDYDYGESSVNNMNQSHISRFGFSSVTDTMPNCLNAIVNDLTNNNKPVIVDAGKDQFNRHAWVIDGYLEDYQSVTITYGFYYVDDPTSLNGTYNGYALVGLYNDEEMAALVPGYVNGAQIVDTASFTHRFFYNKWGENDGQYDTVLADVNYWFAGNTLYNTKRKAFYNLTYTQ